MGRLINSLVLVLVFIALGAVVYQNKRQQDSEERIIKSIWKEIEFRKEVEEGIRQDIDAQRKNLDFVMRLEAEKEIAESLRQEIAETEERQGISYRKLEDSFIKDSEKREEKQKDFENELADYKNKLVEYNLLLQDNIKSLKAYGEKLLENEKYMSGLEEKVGTLDKTVSGFKAKIEDLHKRFSSFQEKLIAVD
jgi:chromosome segregation ATPase